MAKKEKMSGSSFSSKAGSILKNPYFIFGLVIVLFAVSTLFLFMADASNGYRPDWLDHSFLQQVVTIFGVEPYNVRITSWFLLFLFWFAVLLLSFMLFMKKPIRKSIEFKNLNEMSFGELVRFNVIFYLSIALVAAAGYILFFVLFPTELLNWDGDYLAPLMNVFGSLGLFVGFLVSGPLAIAIVVLGFKILIGLFSMIVGNVSKTVMSSSDYQEAYSASKIASSKIREEAEALARSGQIVANIAPGTPVIASAGMANKSSVVFPALSAIDESLREHVSEKENKEVDLKHLASGFQAFLANKRNLYYDADMLRQFIAGLASSKMILLQGLSGTGKTSLPREFALYTSNSASFYPVQATWRDKSDVVGYYSDFVGSYKETELLKTLYKSSYLKEDVNMLVLDEANISRMEYYFADFLSLFEYPSEDWLVSLYQPVEGDVLPELLEDGKLRVSTNTWFVATVNVDDSTFSISDKVYDRVIVIDFEELNHPFKCSYDDEPYSVSYESLMEAFKKAEENDANRLSASELEKFMKVCDFVADTFDVKFGNRIYNQIETFVPTFVALGGTKETALDVMFKTKILRKVDAVYETYVETGLNQLARLISQTYGPKGFAQTQKAILKLKKKFN